MTNDNIHNHHVSNQQEICGRQGVPTQYVGTGILQFDPIKSVFHYIEEFFLELVEYFMQAGWKIWTGPGITDVVFGFRENIF